MQNGFDDFDAKVTAEEFYRGEGYDNDTIDEFVKQDEELLQQWRDLMAMDSSGSFSYEVE